MLRIDSHQSQTRFYWNPRESCTLFTLGCSVPHALFLRFFSESGTRFARVWFFVASMLCWNGLIGSGQKPSPVTEQSSMHVETMDKKPGASTRKKFRGDASKVTAKGPGLKKAFTNRIQNFTVDVKDAGQAVLNVGMIAPSGQPEAELMVKKMTNTSYQISYKVVEIGEHILHVKWGDEDIPGSPFALHT